MAPHTMNQQSIFWSQVCAPPLSHWAVILVLMVLYIFCFINWTHQVAWWAFVWTKQLPCQVHHDHLIWSASNNALCFVLLALGYSVRRKFSVKKTKTQLVLAYYTIVIKIKWWLCPELWSSFFFFFLMLLWWLFLFCIFGLRLWLSVTDRDKLTLPAIQVPLLLIFLYRYLISHQYSGSQDINFVMIYEKRHIIYINH